MSRVLSILNMLAVPSRKRFVRYLDTWVPEPGSHDDFDEVWDYKGKYQMEEHTWSLEYLLVL